MYKHNFLQSHDIFQKNCQSIVTSTALKTIKGTTSRIFIEGVIIMEENHWFRHESTIMLSDSSQGESSVLSVKTHYEYALAHYEHALAEVEYASLLLVHICDGLMCIRNGFLRPSSVTLITELSPWELPLRRILPSLTIVVLPINFFTENTGPKSITRSFLLQFCSGPLWELI